MCENVCPAEIPYSALNKKVRSVAKGIGIEQTCTHGGVFEQISMLMSRTGLQQDRLGWLNSTSKVKKKTGDTLYFTGCSPYFAAYFGEPYAEKLLGSMSAAVNLMNKIGVEPVVLPNERCCGHDMLIRGEEEKFLELAQSVAEQVKESKAERVVFTCPECMVTFRDDYRDAGIDLGGVELVHISQLVEPELENLEFKSSGKKVTYQDPCRLGRYSKIYDQPRNILGNIPDLELVEMDHNHERAICCGNTAWIGCDAGTKVMQKQRLGEAEECGGEMLLTACPKCLIHLTCSQDSFDKQKNHSMPIRDAWEYTYSQLK